MRTHYLLHWQKLKIWSTPGENMIFYFVLFSVFHIMVRIINQFLVTIRGIHVTSFSSIQYHFFDNGTSTQNGKSFSRQADVYYSIYNFFFLSLPPVTSKKRGMQFLKLLFSHPFSHSLFLSTVYIECEGNSDRISESDEKEQTQACTGSCQILTQPQLPGFSMIYIGYW